MDLVKGSAIKTTYKTLSNFETKIKFSLSLHIYLPLK